MGRIDQIAFGVAAVVFAAFTVNVLVGAFTGAPVLSDVAEMLSLFIATIAFVIGTLHRERLQEESAAD